MTIPDGSLLNRQIDEYRIDRQLGSGGMAKVYRAFDTKLKRYVALKVITAERRGDPEYARRFELEAQSIARLEHPNIVHIYRFGESDGLYYMAMQYVEGQDVRWLISDYKASGNVMPIADVVRIVTDVGSALDYAHSKGVIHRDVKPANIIVDQQGGATLTDFGLALLGDVGTLGTIFGSPHYISPEQATSSAQVVPQSDLYSLGVTLFEMLTGELPFNGTTPTEIAAHHVSNAPPPPSHFNPMIPASIDEIVLRSLAKDPFERFQSGAELSVTLAKAVQEWQQSGGEHSSRPQRPPPMFIPQAVNDWLAQAPPAASDSKTTLPPSPSSPAEPPDAATTPSTPPMPDTLAARTQPSRAHVSPLVFGLGIFAIGLILVIAVVLASQRSIGVVVVPTGSPTNTLTDTLTTTVTVLPPAAFPSETPLPPTPTALILPTSIAPAYVPPTDSPLPPTALPTLVPSTPIPSPPTPTAIVIVPPSGTPSLYIVPGTISASITPIQAQPSATGTALTVLFSISPDWFALANTSASGQVLPLSAFTITADGQPLDFSSLKISALNPGDCVQINLHPNPHGDSPPGCSQPFALNPSGDNGKGKGKKDNGKGNNPFNPNSTITIRFNQMELAFSLDHQWLAISDVSGAALPLNGITLSAQTVNRDLSQVATVSALSPGQCVRLYQGHDPPKSSPPDCTAPLDQSVDALKFHLDTNPLSVTFSISP